MHPRVNGFLYGSLGNWNWTAESGSSFMVLLCQEFLDFVLRRGKPGVFRPSIPTDPTVHSEREFDRLRANPTSPVAQEFPSTEEASW